MLHFKYHCKLEKSQVDILKSTLSVDTEDMPIKCCLHQEFHHEIIHSVIILLTCTDILNLFK